MSDRGSDPLSRRCDHGRRRRSWICTARSLEPANRSNGHVVVAEDLARKANARQATLRQPIALGHRHARGFALDELDAARRAPCVAPARMQLIDSSILLEREHEPLSFRDIKRTETFNSQIGHLSILVRASGLLQVLTVLQVLKVS